MQRHRGGDVETDRLRDELGPDGDPSRRQAGTPSQGVDDGAKHHVAGDHAGAGRDPDLVFLLAERPAGFDVALVELPREQQREMLLLDPADQLGVGLEHRRDRRHLLFRLDEGVDALRQCRLDRRPKPAQPRAGGLIEGVELQPWLEIGREIETHGIRCRRRGRLFLIPLIVREMLKAG